MAQPRIQFAVIGLKHPHIYAQVDALLRGGGELVTFLETEPVLAAQFSVRFPSAKPARCVEEILEDRSIHLVASASIPNERAALGITVMSHGKDFMCDKPGFTTLDQLAEARRAQAETERIFSIFYCERLDHPATVQAEKLVKAGAIGHVRHTVGLGPHLPNPASRPGWFFKRQHFGGIITDIGSHQVDQFLVFTGSTAAEVVASQIANYRYPQYPEFEDFGELLLCSAQGSGYIRVDWLTPNGLGTWGDGRLTILGTEGFIEVRKNCDLPSCQKGNHLFLVDQKGSHYMDCSDVVCPYGAQMVDDVLNRTETAMTQEHCFLVSELALKAQAQARRLDNNAGA